MLICQRSQEDLIVWFTDQEHDCKLTREIVELVDREADLLVRGIKSDSLRGKVDSPLILLKVSNLTTKLWFGSKFSEMVLFPFPRVA